MMVFAAIQLKLDSLLWMHELFHDIPWNCPLYQISVHALKRHRLITIQGKQVLTSATRRGKMVML